jgi:hypothetical protein
VGIVLRSSGRAGRSRLLAVACLVLLLGIPGPATRAYGVGRAAPALGSSLRCILPTPLPSNWIGLLPKPPVPKKCRTSSPTPPRPTPTPSQPPSSPGPAATASGQIPASKTEGPRAGSGPTGAKPASAGGTSGHTNQSHGRKFHARPADGRSPLAKGPWLPLLLIAVFLLTVRRLARLS